MDFIGVMAIVFEITLFFLVHPVGSTIVNMLYQTFDKYEALLTIKQSKQQTMNFLA